MSALRRLIGIATLGLQVAACTAVGGQSFMSSGSRAELSAAAADAIAGDIVSRLAERIGPGKATIVLKIDDSPFGRALEGSLRRWGYAVATDQKADERAIALAYVVDTYDGTVLARLTTPQFALGRAYKVTATGASPSSPVSVLERG
ncbi:conjugal transfer protein TrbH (plasmid) [Afipia carboxidovorans OM5]|uniref:Conjugal transfer protein TrbH n=1 Tax=Afipia carboxidovorans (strain ATCC 49405 / DSM 1227 / KCTC 32145 / OM5) TaxID=504832 RepID=Q6LB41_AFIC5|nr:conjugal transfer protein TrbH [Afipia carboxidovorans]AEI04560.1 conjugal transfer protein TrbH [Afipia carboxidovorans OM4]AEI08189.1 conjugal transfer protein TrbH [Afipia carboxidovorans OM5]